MLDLCFLAGTPRPTLATLHEDSKHQRYLKTHEVAVRDKALSDGPWPQVDCSMCLCVSPHPVLLPRGSTALGGPAHVSGRRLPSRRRHRSSSRFPSEACSSSPSTRCASPLGAAHTLPEGASAAHTAPLRLRSRATRAAPSARTRCVCVALLEPAASPRRGGTPPPPPSPQVSASGVPTIFRAHGRVDPDGTRWLLSDAAGTLHVLDTS